MKAVQLKIAAALIALMVWPSLGKISIAASLSDFASIANSIGGERVKAFAIAKPSRNLHSVEVLPSYMVKVARARIYIKVGLGSDNWSEPIISGSRNTQIKIVDASKGISVLDKPEGKVSAAMGDVHPEGNPHYWLDPNNADIIAKTIGKALIEVDPEGADYYKAQMQRFTQEAEKNTAQLQEKMKPYSNQAIFTYHSSWRYFARAFNLRIVGTVEPVPGIPPTAKQLQELVTRAKSEKILLLLQAPYFPKEGSLFLKRHGGIPTYILSPSCAGPKPGDYWDHLNQLADVFTQEQH